MKQTNESLQRLIDQCQFHDWNISLRDDNGRPYVQITFNAIGSVSGIVEEQRCRKWALSYFMCDTEVIQTVYAAIERAVIHETKEFFLYKGRRVFNPHVDINTLWGISEDEKHIDKRDETLGSIDIRSNIYYTDYPFEELGDTSGEEAPIREVVPLKYDGNKYCDVLVGGITSNIKVGYIYTQRGRLGEVPVIDPTIISGEKGNE